MYPLLRSSVLAAALAILVGRGTGVCAESGAVHTGRGFGLKMTVDTRWLSGSGYRPVTIDVVPLVPVVADRTLTVEFVVHRYRGRGREEDWVLQEIEIPAGSGPVRTTMSIPPTPEWGSYHINVWEDGKLLRPLSHGGPADLVSGMAWEESFPKILVVADSLPDTSPVAKLFPVEEYNQYLGINPSSAGKMSLPTAIARKPAELPERWIDYTTFDIICVPLEQLDSLSRRRPEAFLAIVEWTASGGNLCVCGMGRNWSRLGQLESLLGFEPGDAATAADPSSRGWSLPDEKLFNKRLRGMGHRGEDETQGDAGLLYSSDLSEELDIGLDPLPELPDEPPFVFRELQQGMVVAMAAADPLPGTKHEWGWLLGTLGSRRVLWCQRHGLSTFRENREFWKFLIPGVGLAPVTAFRVLITLFVLAIGPLNYVLLRRWKRLHLLILTTPASAAAVTLLLFGYALAADGLGTRVRVRSATHIDQRRGHAVCWSRLSYYAGLAPAGGLVFPADVAVVPFERAPVDTRSRRRKLVWTTDQWLASGWITSRTPCQFVTVRSRPVEWGLGIAAPNDGTVGRIANPSHQAANPSHQAEAIRIDNRLHARVEQLLVRSEDGRYWWASGIEPDGQARAVPVDRAVAFRRLQQTHRRWEPSYPPGTDPEGMSSSGGYRRFRRSWLYGQTNLPEPTQATSRLETAISVLRSRPGGPAASIEPRSYLAIVDRSPEVVLGTPRAREEAGFHLVHGIW